MLKISGLRVSVNGGPKLLGIDMAVKERESVAVLGPNGAGKTTLMRAIVGLLTPTAGEVLFKGERVRQDTEKWAKKGLVLAPQNHPIFPTLTVEEHLDLTSGARETRDEVLELFPELRQHLHRIASSLSGGQRQMLSLAQSLTLRPSLLLLDEPSSGLAPKVVERVFRVIEKVARRDMSILLVEQNAAIALDVTDRAVVLENGRTVMEGDAETMKTDRHIKEAYLGL